MKAPHIVGSPTKETVSFATLLVALGIVFGDIGTSPLYVFTAITKGKNFDPLLVYGSVSCVIWTLILIATVKYIYLALNADNQGEGGIFALYALLRKKKASWIIYPALVGCAALLSDGFITPAISISSAVEGLSKLYPALPIIPIVCVILIVLFSFQQFGTNVIGRLFGPVMVVWFLLIGTLGVLQLVKDASILAALNPYYAIDFLVVYPNAIWILGAVFLCTTGAEALYSDLGHCGKRNIRISWVFVFSMLLLNYLGQASYCLNLPAGYQTDSIFYDMVPKGFLIPAIIVATVATIIASQALLTGIFTLVNEAIKLRLWTNLKVKYPSTHKGQVYIPFINGFLLVGCLSVVLLFKKSSNMEAAYGLAITLNMIVTTFLLAYLLYIRHRKYMVLVVLFTVFYFVVEGFFLYSNLSKVMHGGWFTLVLTVLFFFLFFIYHQSRLLRKRVSEFKELSSVLPVLEAVLNDKDLPYLTNNLVYPTRSVTSGFIDITVIHSLFHAQPKRAGIYWFLHLDITDDPYGSTYKVTTLIPEKCFFVRLKLGFKEPHLLETYMHEVYENLLESGEIKPTNVFKSMKRLSHDTDFKFILINSRVATDNDLSAFDMITVRMYRIIKSIGLNKVEDYGLNEASTIQEVIPINIRRLKKTNLTRIKN